MEPAPRVDADRLRILVVEDDATHAELIRRAFEDTPEASITVAHRLDDALAIARRDPLDIVIADLRLPDGRGIDMCGVTQCPTVIMTSQGNEADAVEAMRAGALDYVVKSDAMFSEMPHVVQRALREWALQGAHARANRQLQSQFEIAAALATERTLAVAGPRLLESIGRCVGWPAGELWRVDETADALRREAVWIAADELGPLASDEAATPLAEGEGIPGATWERGKRIAVSQLDELPEVVRRSVVTELGLACAYGFPVHTADGSTFAVFAFYAQQIETPTDDIERLFTTVSAHLNVFAERQREAEERRRLQRELVQRERLAAVGETAATLAHEIANPLNSMYLQAQLLQRRLSRLEEIGPEITTSVDLLLSENARLAGLLQEFRSLARREALRLETTDLSAVLGEILTLDEPLLARASVALVRAIAPELPRFMADAPKLKQVFTNLIKNAAEAMPSGGRLTVTAEHENESITVSIADTGVGLPEGVDVFEPFRTTKPLGTGLGLPLARRILEAHGGTIECGPADGGGAVFRVQLPLRPDQA